MVAYGFLKYLSVSWAVNPGNLSPALLGRPGEEEHGVNRVVISFSGLIGAPQIGVHLFYLGTSLEGHAGGGSEVGTV